MSDAQVGRRILAHKECGAVPQGRPRPYGHGPGARPATRLRPISGGRIHGTGPQKNTVAQVIEADGDWHTIRLSRSDDPTGVYGVKAGPFHYLLDAHLTTAEMPAGAVLMVRAVNTKGDADDVVSDAPIASCIASSRNAQHFAYSAGDYTDEGQWLRLQVQTTQQVSLTVVETSTTIW